MNHVIQFQPMFIITGNMKKEKELEEMLSQAPGQLNFTVFLAMMGDKIKGKQQLIKKLAFVKISCLPNKHSHDS